MNIFRGKQIRFLPKSATIGAAQVAIIFCLTACSPPQQGPMKQVEVELLESGACVIDGKTFEKAELQSELRLMKASNANLGIQIVAARDTKQI